MDRIATLIGRTFAHDRYGSDARLFAAAYAAGFLFFLLLLL